MTWNELPTQAQEDLTEWCNQAGELTGNERTQLAKLYAAGRFHAWDCPTCGDRVYAGDPKDWGDYQGVRQRDLTSYPGWAEVFTREIIDKQCDDCRCRLNPAPPANITREDVGL